MEDDKLTIEELKQIEGFENISDTEAEKVIDSLRQFSKILYRMYISESNLK